MFNGALLRASEQIITRGVEWVSKSQSSVDHSALNDDEKCIFVRTRIRLHSSLY